MSLSALEGNGDTCIKTENNHHDIFHFLFYYFLCLEIAGSIFFINHITWHDAPKFTLSVYRNTLNRTQGFTMDTRLTFCPLHLQQWMTFSRFLFHFFLLLSCLVTRQIISISPNTSWSSNKGILLCYCHGGFFFLFNKHNMYRNSTQTGYVSEYRFCSTVVNNQYKSATYTMLMQ